jgi:flagellar biogenesis protein FliO
LEYQPMALSLLLAGVAEGREPMLQEFLQDAVAMLLIIVIVPLCAIVVMRGIAKTKRQRRPVQNFRLK